MSINKLISKICNLPEALGEEVVPFSNMLKEAFLFMQSRIKKKKTGAFRFTHDETLLLLLALDKAIEHGYLEAENERLSGFEKRVQEGLRALNKYGTNHPSGKGYREMAKFVRAGTKTRKGKDWSDIFCYFSALEGTDAIKTILVRVAIKYDFPSPSPLIKELRKKYKVEGLPSHDSEFARTSTREHEIAQERETSKE